MSENISSDPFMVSIPNADISAMEVDRTCHVFVNGRELPECETYAWFLAAIEEKAAREQASETAPDGGRRRVKTADSAKMSLERAAKDKHCLESME